MQTHPQNPTIEDRSDSEKNETLVITRAEYNALDLIYGLSPLVHSMVMLAENDSQSGRFTLKGSSETFEALQRDLSEEIYSELSPRTRLNSLRKIYRRLSPDGEF
jgi:hypothetical protein